MPDSSLAVLGRPAEARFILHTLPLPCLFYSSGHVPGRIPPGSPGDLSEHLLDASAFKGTAGELLARTEVCGLWVCGPSNCSPGLLPTGAGLFPV